MKLWPYDSFEIRTQLSVEALTDALNEHIEPKKWFRLSRNHKPFQGTHTAEGFRIARIIHYRNSFLPVITGSFRHRPSEINIAVRMRLHPLAMAFMSVWFGGFTLFLVLVLAAVFTGRAVQYPLLLIPFGMLLFGWALVSGSFWLEAKKAESLLLDMFNRRSRSPTATISA